MSRRTNVNNGAAVPLGTIKSKSQFFINATDLNSVSAAQYGAGALLDTGAKAPRLTRKRVVCKHKFGYRGRKTGGIGGSVVRAREYYHGKSVVEYSGPAPLSTHHEVALEKLSVDNEAIHQRQLAVKRQHEAAQATIESYSPEILLTTAQMAAIGVAAHSKAGRLKRLNRIQRVVSQPQ